MKRLSYKDKTIILRVSITETHLKKLDEMSGDNQRSALTRKLIDQEWERRQVMKAKAEATNGSN